MLFDVLGRLEMIRITAEAGVVAAFEDAEGRFVHHLLRAASGALHLADGLLGERQEEAALPTRGDVAGRTQTQTVTEADR